MTRKRRPTPVDPLATAPMAVLTDDITITWDEEATRLYDVQTLRRLLKEAKQP